jgi:hypothetical protein
MRSNKIVKLISWYMDVEEKKEGNELNDAWVKYEKLFFKSIDLVNNLGCYKYRENSTKI